MSRYAEIVVAREPKTLRDWTGRWNALADVASLNGATAERIEEFCSRKGITLDALTALGTRVATHRQRTCLAFAGWNRDGSGVVALKYRPLDGTSDESEAERPSSWLRPIVVGDLSSLDWFIAEGETDAARLFDLVGDHGAILVLPAGALSFKAEWADRIPRGAAVYLCHDADEAGDKGARNAAKLLGRPVRLRPPETDWCDWPGTREEFVQLVAEARAQADARRGAGRSLPLHVPTRALVRGAHGRGRVTRPTCDVCGKPDGQPLTSDERQWFRSDRAEVDHFASTPRRSAPGPKGGAAFRGRPSACRKAGSPHTQRREAARLSLSDFDESVAHAPLVLTKDGAEFGQQVGRVECARTRSGLCARDYFAHIGALQRDLVRNGCADLIDRCPRGRLGLKDDHRQPVTSVVSPSPVAGDKPRGGRDAGHNLLIQHLSSGVSVVDRDLYHYGMHSAPPVERRIAATLGHSPSGGKFSDGSERLHEPVANTCLMFEEQHSTELREAAGRVVERPQDLLPLRHRQREYLRLDVVRVLEPLGRVVEAGIAEQTRELEHVLIADGDAGEHHRGVRE